MVVITWEYVGQEKQRFVVWFSNMGSHTINRNDNTMEMLGPLQLETSKHQMLDVGKRLNWNTKLKYHIWSFQMGIVFQCLIDVAHLLYYPCWRKTIKSTKSVPHKHRWRYLMCDFSYFSVLVPSKRTYNHSSTSEEVEPVTPERKWPCQPTRPLTCGCNWITTKIFG